jgi:hypothetical protein
MVAACPGLTDPMRLIDRMGSAVHKTRGHREAEPRSSRWLLFATAALVTNGVESSSPPRASAADLVAQAAGHPRAHDVPGVPGSCCPENLDRPRSSRQDTRDHTRHHGHDEPNHVGEKDQQRPAEQHSEHNANDDDQPNDELPSPRWSRAFRVKGAINQVSPVPGP